MAKKKVKAETKEIVVDVSQLVSVNDKYIGDVSRFLEEKFEDSKTTKDGNILRLTVDKGLSRRDVKQNLKKFLYLANLSNYRVIALQDDDKGYKIYEKPQIE